MWIARDIKGYVTLHRFKPYLDGHYFFSDYGNDIGFELGKKPKLDFKLKRGESNRIKIKFEVYK